MSASAIFITPPTPLDDRASTSTSAFEYESETPAQPHHSAFEFERQPLILEPDTPVTPEAPRDSMGYDEQFVKPEGRRGDAIALWAALVRVFSVLSPAGLFAALCLTERVFFGGCGQISVGVSARPPNEKRLGLGCSRERTYP